MGLSCKVLGHKWNGCKCERCGEIRDTDHMLVLQRKTQADRYPFLVEVSLYVCSVCGAHKESTQNIAPARLVASCAAQIPGGLHNTLYKVMILTKAYVDPFAGFNFQNKLEEIQVDPGNPLYASVDGILYDKEVKKLIACPPARTRKLVIPKTVTCIEENAFRCCYDLEEIAVPTVRMQGTAFGIAGV